MAAQPAPSIDHAEALIVELAGIIPHLNERDQSNITYVLDVLGRIDGGLPDAIVAGIEDALTQVGPSNRAHDRIDREIAAAMAAAVTHWAVVEEYARRHAGHDTGRAHVAIRSELIDAYGAELGPDIAEAAFHRYLHDRYPHHPNVDPATCERCWKD